MRNLTIVLSFILVLYFATPAISTEILLPQAPSDLLLPLQTEEIPMQYMTENDENDMIAARRRYRKKRRYRHKPRYRHKRRYRHGHRRGGCFISDMQFTLEPRTGEEIPEIILEIK